MRVRDSEVEVETTTADWSPHDNRGEELAPSPAHDVETCGTPMSDASFETPSPARFSPVLLTDLYALTMLQAYFEEHMSDVAVFSLFVRRLPDRRNYLLACGLDDVLAFSKASDSINRPLRTFNRSAAFLMHFCGTSRASIHGRRVGGS